MALPCRGAAFLFFLSAAGAPGAATVSCGHAPPAPVRGPPPPPASYVEVPYPPPPGRVEILPERPEGDGVVWVDGQWASFARDRWVWQPGAWVRPPAGATFTAWRLERRPDGRLWFAPPAWHGADGREAPPPEALALARHGEPSTGGAAREDEGVGRAVADVAPAPPTPTAAPLLPDAALIPPRLAPSGALPGPPIDTRAGDPPPELDAGAPPP